MFGFKFVWILVSLKCLFKCDSELQGREVVWLVSFKAEVFILSLDKKSQEEWIVASSRWRRGIVKFLEIKKPTHGK